METRGQTDLSGRFHHVFNDGRFAYGERKDILTNFSGQLHGSSLLAFFDNASDVINLISI